MTVKIKAAFKKDQKPFDGLVAIEGNLVDEEMLHEVYVVVATIRPHRIDVLAEDGAKSATVRFDHIEVLDGEDATVAKGLLTGRYRDRTGRDDEPQPSLFDGPDGEREVPEASAEELLAERAEAKAAKGKG